MILDWSDYDIRRARLPDGRTVHYDRAMVLVCGTGTPEDPAIDGVTKWVESRSSRKPYAKATSSLGDLLVWAFRRSPSSFECEGCERMVRPLVPQRIHDAWFDRARVFDLLQPWVQARLPATSTMRLELAKELSPRNGKHVSGTILTVRCDSFPGTFTTLMSVLAPKPEDAGTDPFEPAEMVWA